MIPHMCFQVVSCQAYGASNESTICNIDYMYRISNTGRYSIITDIVVVPNLETGTLVCQNSSNLDQLHDKILKSYQTHPTLQ